MNRKASREEVIKILYSIDINKNFESFSLNDYLDNFTTEDISLKDLDIKYIEQTLFNTKSNIENIDSLINANLKDWKINRLAKVDLAILRTSISEILYDNTIPASVSINEAVEISKKYSNEVSHKFINGILGSVFRGFNK